MLNVTGQREGSAEHANPLTLYLMDDQGNTGTDGSNAGITIDEGCSLMLTAPGVHQLGVILDGGPQIVMFVVDGMLCDGGSTQLRGWQWLWPALAGNLGGAGVTGIDLGGSGSVRSEAEDLLTPIQDAAAAAGGGGGSAGYGGKLLGARVYSRALKVSEMVGNAMAGPPSPTTIAGDYP